MARRVLATADGATGATGAINVDGKMVDRQPLAHAQAIFDQITAVQGDAQNTN